MDLKSEQLLLIPPVDTKLNALAGFWRWVEMLASDDYEQAFAALRWPGWGPQSPEALKVQITTFFGGDAPWSVVVPNARLVGVVNDAAIYQPQNDDGWGWLMAQIPLTTEPADPKDDNIPLMGLATSFFVRQYQGYYVFDFEIFHVGPWRAADRNAAE